MAAQVDIVARCGKGHRWTEDDLTLLKRVGTVKRSIAGRDLYEHTYDCGISGCGNSITVYGEGAEVLSEFEAQRILGKGIEHAKAEHVNRTLSEATSIAGSARDSFAAARQYLSDTNAKLNEAGRRLERLSKLVKPSGAFDAACAASFLRELQTTWAHLLPSDGGHTEPITRETMRDLLNNIVACVEDVRKGL